MFSWRDPLKTMNWGKECSPSVYISCIRIMICLLKTSLHLQALCFNQHQKNNYSDGSQTWSFWHPGYPGNRSIKTNSCFRWKCCTFFTSVLEAHKVSPSTMQQNNVFISFLSLNVLGQRKKEKRKQIHFEHVRMLLLQGNISGEI